MIRVLSVFIMLLSFIINSHALEGSTKGFPKPAVEFENLVNEDAKPTKLSDFRGKVVILYFGFTSCKHVCPTVTAALKQVSEKLKEKGLGGKYQIVLVTVDPNDTPDKLKEYKKTRALDEFTFLTGKVEDLKKAWDAYGIEVKEKVIEMEHAGHTMKHKMISHTPVRTVIIDKSGTMVEEWLGIYLPVEKIAKDVEELIRN